MTPRDQTREAAAEALWLWAWTVDQGRHHIRLYPYERLIEATKDDLRRLADAMGLPCVLPQQGGPDEAAVELLHRVRDQAPCIKIELEADIADFLYAHENLTKSKKGDG